jgi:putative transcriptional regulator
MVWRRLMGLVVAVVVAAASLAAAAQGTGDDAAPGKFSRFLKGQFLVATSRIGDPRFARTVIYMISHDVEGAMGLIINRAYGRGPLAGFLEGFGIDPGDAEGEVVLRYGGPVEPGRGFVLHGGDFESPGATPIGNGLVLNTDRDILEAIARGEGPRRALFILGYSGWGPSQLEGEMARDDWVSAPADADLVFDQDLDSLWERVLPRAGIKM